MVLLDFSSMSNEKVVDAWLSYNTDAKELLDKRDRTLAEIRLRMTTDEATKMLHPMAKVELVTKPVFNLSVLNGLREFLTEDELVAAGALKLAATTEVTSEETWNMTKVNTLASLGKDIREVIERARTETYPTVKITPVKEESK
jgi:hypothetical protein